jgi:predicted secreted protein
MNFIRLFVTTFLLLFTSTAALATDCSENSSPKVQFDASASQLAENDSIRATLFVEVQNSTPNGASAQVTQAANEALQVLQNDANLRVHTGAYRTYPVSEKGSIKAWRARSELIVESDQIDRVSAAIEAVSGSMQLASVEFFPSASTRKQVEDALVDQAIKAFLDKARRIAKSFEAERFEMCEASVTNLSDVPPPRPLMRAMAADSVATAPEFGSGTTRLSVTVTGTILIRR